MAASGSLADLTCCSICLETFTRPKVLPCQHTFCYSCLLSIGKARTNITCPQCREEYEIPEDGISAFKDNLLANSLLELWSAQKETLCSDCRSKPAVSPCEHCKANVCAPCFSQHIKLAMELKMAISEVREKISTEMSYEKREGMEKSKVECMKQLQDLKAFRSLKIREFFRSSRRLERFMEMVSQIHDEMLESSDSDVENSQSYFSVLADKADRCTTIDSLKSLRKDAGDLRTVIRIIQDSNEPFRFVPNAGSHENTLGQIEVGQAVVNIQGSYESDSFSLEELVEVFRVVVKTQPPIHEGLTKENQNMANEETRDGNDNEATIPAENKIVDAKAQSSSPSEAESLTCSAGEPTTDSQASIAGSTQQQPSSTEVSLLPLSVKTYRQNQLPRNVDYYNKSKGPMSSPVTTLELDPLGAAYHVDTGHIYIADFSKQRVMMYSGHSASVFCKVATHPLDVAISTDGAYIYIASKGQLSKANLNGEIVNTITTCSLGPLNDCMAVVCHNEFTVVVDRQFRSVIIYDKKDREVRHVGEKYLIDPTAVAISVDGEMFVTDGNDSSIEVFKWSGQFSETFLSSKQVQPYGEVAVDADGFIYVLNRIKHSIDVYDRKGTLMATKVGSSAKLQSPFRITLTPDGRIIVTDYPNKKHRIQMSKER